MDPLLHYLCLQTHSTFADSPEAARRRETLREHERDSRLRRAQRRQARVRVAVALATVRGWRYDGELAGRAG
jgi:hypothetical protein